MEQSVAERGQTGAKGARWGRMGPNGAEQGENVPKLGQMMLNRTNEVEQARTGPNGRGGKNIFLSVNPVL